MNIKIKRVVLILVLSLFFLEANAKVDSQQEDYKKQIKKLDSQIKQLVEERNSLAAKLNDGESKYGIFTYMPSKGSKVADTSTELQANWGLSSNY